MRRPEASRELLFVAAARDRDGVEAHLRCELNAEMSQAADAEHVDKLEHEGLLAVRRGPGGGYYGTRPDEAALERAFAAYLRVHGYGHRESQRMMSLLDLEVVPAAARCKDENLRQAVRGLLERVDSCDTIELRIAFEIELRDLLLRMVAAPLIELLCRVTSRLYAKLRSAIVFLGKEAVVEWKIGRRRILEAILEQDAELAHFEAERYRRVVLSRLHDAAD